MNICRAAAHGSGLESKEAESETAQLSLKPKKFVWCPWQSATGQPRHRQHATLFFRTSNRSASRDYILGFRTESKTLSARGGLGRFSATGADLLRFGNAVPQDRAGLQ